jgi:uncharacterized protein (TIGR02466 family)
MNYTIETLFPSTVLCANIGREFSQEEIDISKHYENHVLKNESGNFYSENTNIFNTELPELKTIVEYYINCYAKQIMGVRDDITFYITQSWFNYTYMGQKHVKHSHPNSILSGVLYFNTMKDGDKLKFFSSSYENQEIMILPSTYNYYNSKSWWLPVSPGDLVIFQSKLHHEVPTVTDDIVRISLAFNVFVKGQLGSETYLTSLIL